MKMSSLESRRRLLIAESELNRALLIEDCSTLASGLSNAARSYGHFALVAGSVATIFGLHKTIQTWRSTAQNKRRSTWMLPLLRFLFVLWVRKKARQG